MVCLGRVDESIQQCCGPPGGILVILRICTREGGMLSYHDDAIGWLVVL